MQVEFSIFQMNIRKCGHPYVSNEYMSHDAETQRWHTLRQATNLYQVSFLHTEIVFMGLRMGQTPRSEKWGKGFWSFVIYEVLILLFGGYNAALLSFSVLPFLKCRCSLFPTAEDLLELSHIPPLSIQLAQQEHILNGTIVKLRVPLH